MALLLHNAYLADSSQICLTIWLNTWVIYHNPEKLENRHGPKCLPCKVSRLMCSLSFYHQLTEAFQYALKNLI